MKIKIELKKLKHSEFASRETVCFQCDVWSCGGKLGTAFNDGMGGPTSVEPERLRNGLDLYASTLPPMDLATVCPEWVNDPRRYLKMTAETLIEQLVEEHLEARQRRAAARRAKTAAQ